MMDVLPHVPPAKLN